MDRIRRAAHAVNMCRMSRIGPVVLLASLLTTVGSARADDLPLAALPAEATAKAADEAPRFTQADLPATPQRSLPGYRSETSELSYRWWTRGERADLGVGVGSVVQVTRPTGMLPGLAASGAVQWSGSATALLLGVRVRTSERATVYADAAIGQGLGGAVTDPVSGKLGFELKAARSRWDIAYGGLGLRLAGDSRMSLRLRRSGLAVNWHQSF